jgi:maleylpyruvate isomerase
MYASPDARDAAIAETAKLPAADLIADCGAAAQRLTAAVRQLPEPAWTAEVRTAQDRTVPASEVPWMRCREVWVHTVDLDVGVGFGDIPDGVLTALMDDVTRTWQRRHQVPEVRFSTGTREWGAGPVTVTGDLPNLAAWVSGRSPADRLAVDGAPPSLPTWL